MNHTSLIEMIITERLDDVESGSNRSQSGRDGSTRLQPPQVARCEL